jgi:hypothetical protein
MKLAAVFCLTSLGLANAGLTTYGYFESSFPFGSDANAKTKRACTAKGMIYITDTYDKPHLCQLPSLNAAKTWERKATAKVTYHGNCKTQKGTDDACDRVKGKSMGKGYHSCTIPNWKAAKAFACPENKKPKKKNPNAPKPKAPKVPSKTCKVASNKLSYRRCGTMKTCPPIADVQKGTSIKFTCWAKGDAVKEKGGSILDRAVNQALSGKWGKDTQGRFFYLAYINNLCAREFYPFFPLCICGTTQKNKLTPSRSPTCAKSQTLLAIWEILLHTIHTQALV